MQFRPWAASSTGALAEEMLWQELPEHLLPQLLPQLLEYAVLRWDGRRRSRVAQP